MPNEIIYYVLTKENAHVLDGANVFDKPILSERLNAFALNSGHEMVFAVKNTVVVGFSSGSVLLHPDKAPAFLINEVGVEIDFRNKGIGAELTNKLIEIARNKGCQGIWLATEVDNVEARALYRKLNARETKDIIVYDWDGAMDEL